MTQDDGVRQAVLDLLQAVGEDPRRSGLRDTPARVASLYRELFSGVGADPAGAISTVFKEERPGQQTVVLRDVPFHSICEHHLLPFHGVAHLGYVPARRIAGASKLVRALELASRRPQVQERMTAQLADAIESALQPVGVGVIIEAEHLCMTMRGVRKPGSRIHTSVVRGTFAPANAAPSRVRREEFVALLRGK